MDSLEDENIIKEENFKSEFNSIYPSTDNLLKNIVKTIQKIAKLYQFESHEIIIQQNHNSAHHV